MNAWLYLLLSVAGSFIGSTLTFILFFRPLTNVISAKVHRKMMKQISKAEDAFASRTKKL